MQQDIATVLLNSSRCEGQFVICRFNSLLHLHEYLNGLMHNQLSPHTFVKQHLQFLTLKSHSTSPFPNPFLPFLLCHQCTQVNPHYSAPATYFLTHSTVTLMLHLTPFTSHNSICGRSASNPEILVTERRERNAMQSVAWTTLSPTTDAVPQTPGLSVPPSG